MKKQITLLSVLMVFVFVTDSQSDEWNSRNDPTLFSGDFDYTLSNLPQTGKASNRPWTPTYWPVYNNQLAMQFTGRSITRALRKYKAAFGDLTDDRESSNKKRNKDQRWWQFVSPYKGPKRPNDNIDPDNDGNVGDDSDDANDGVETWWGLWNAWVPAAMLQPAPQRSVIYDSVVFHTQDMEALLILVSRYARITKMGGGGLYVDNEDALKNDQTNAGAFFIVLTNMLGIGKKSLAVDRTDNNQLLSQPIAGYRIRKKIPVSEYKALDLLGYPNARSYSEIARNKNVAEWYYIKLILKYVPYARTRRGKPKFDRLVYEMILELDKNGLITGGEWIKPAKSSLPDVVWLPEKSGISTGSLDYHVIEALLNISRRDSDTGVNEMTKADIIEHVATPSEDDNDDSPAGR